MKTWYIYGKLSRECYHITATLSRTAPKSYHSLFIVDARNRSDALHAFLVVKQILAPEVKVNIVKQHRMLD